MKKIHVDDIIKEAAKLKGWYLTGTNKIRIKLNQGANGSIACCPLTCGIFKTQVQLPHNYRTVTDELDITHRTGRSIWSAADARAFCNLHTRKKMMKAFGLDTSTKK